MEKGTIIGLVMAVLAFSIAAVVAAWPNLVILGWLVDAASFVLVIFGAMASTMIAMPFPVFRQAMSAQKLVFRPPVFDATEGINTIVSLANTARKEGVLALEDSATNMDDEFLKKGVMLIVDGTDPELVKAIMETELSYIEERHNDIARVFDTLNGLFPAWGMMGTLIGLILMLADLTDMEALASGMALALITTLYGSLAANIYAMPFSTKLKQINKEETLIKTVLIEGMLSIQAGENPRIIEEKLKSFLAPALRDGIGEGAAVAAVAGGADE